MLEGPSLSKGLLGTPEIPGRPLIKDHVRRSNQICQIKNDPFCSQVDQARPPLRRQRPGVLPVASHEAVPAPTVLVSDGRKGVDHRVERDEV